MCLYSHCYNALGSDTLARFIIVVLHIYTSINSTFAPLLHYTRRMGNEFVLHLQMAVVVLVDYRLYK